MHKRQEQLKPRRKPQFKHPRRYNQWLSLLSRLNP